MRAISRTLGWLVPMMLACGPGPLPATGRTRTDAGVLSDARADRAQVDAPSSIDSRRDDGTPARDAAWVAEHADRDGVGDSDAAAPDASADTASDRPVARAPRPGDLFIDEVLIDPAGDDLGREWFEAASLALDVLDLSGLHVADGASDAPVDFGVLAGGGLLAPGGLVVLGQSADPSKNGGAPVAGAYGTRLILNNGSDRVAICAGPCASGVVLDTFVWSALGAGYQGHAVVIPAPGSTAICPAADPFGTAGSFGTPGAPNPPCAMTGTSDAGP
jgi:hypothetical protein